MKAAARGGSVEMGEAARGGVAEAQHNIGAMLVSARGVKRDYNEGLDLYSLRFGDGEVQLDGRVTRAYVLSGYRSSY